MSDTGFVGSIPDVYDAYLVPLIFESYANDMAAKIAACGPSDVLEVAAGSGVVSRALARSLGQDARLTITDLNSPMLDRARRQQPDESRLTWQPADALALPFDDGCFDAIACQFGVMFYPDRAAGHAEARRVLRPGGRYVFNVWDHIGVNEFADEVTRAVSDLFPDQPTQFLARIPHGYHNQDEVLADVRTAGFTDVKIETLTARSNAASPDIPAIAYCQGTPLRNEIEACDAARLDEATQVATDALTRRFGQGAISGLIQAHVVVATAD
jgi:ubiquinone/menaquinone biosynthesis C-methylase UbiE